jgi:hypothetical protein
LSEARLLRNGSDLLNDARQQVSNHAIMKRSKPALQPTLMCAWCKGIIRPAGLKISHGICGPCVKHWFGKLRTKTPPLAA